jgi:hypothetical protein
LDGFLVSFWDGVEFEKAILGALQADWDREAMASRARASGWERTAELVLEEFGLAVRSAARATQELARQ